MLGNPDSDELRLDTDELTPDTNVLMLESADIIEL